MQDSPASAAQLLHLEERLPTRGAARLFRLKALCFQARRLWQDALAGPARHGRREALLDEPVRGFWKSDLWHESSAPRERLLLLGKVHNLRAAARSLDGIEVPAGALFSFWRQIGRATHGRGFAVGRELREGCLIPTIGGGLCQLTGALYNAALEAGLEIVERHGHSLRSISTLAKLGRDATVFWNYVDLRLRAPVAWRLEVRISPEHLYVRIRTATARRANMPAESPDGAPAAAPNSCGTCGIDDCFRHKNETTLATDRIAWLVDDGWPEYTAEIATRTAPGDLLCRPLDGRRWRKPAYAWPVARFAKVRHATLLAFRRAWAVRRLREQGAARQRALLTWDERLAQHFARALQPEHTHLVVAQSLLPFLWREGVLGGRTFDVLMQRLPLRDLQTALDHAAALHPESHTCADFRAPAWLLRAETEALAAARQWITPHAELARLAGERALLLPWQTPAPRARPAVSSKRVIFPASTLCRKGAYELREAARRLDLEVVCLGGILEGADFWAGVRLAEPAADWLEGAACVVLPAFVEHRPRRLLQALAAAVPVAATPACGLAASELVTLVPAGDVEALTAALALILLL